MRGLSAASGEHTGLLVGTLSCSFTQLMFPAGIHNPKEESIVDVLYLGR